MKKHAHRTKTTHDRAFSHAVRFPENRAAHGNICVVDTCKCGAKRETNVNQNHVERGTWTATERDPHRRTTMPKPRRKTPARAHTRRDAKILPFRRPEPASHDVYFQNERARFHADLQRVEKGSLADRKAAAKEWKAALHAQPELIAERVGWLLNGSYGKGSYDAARETVTNKRMNSGAWLATTIAALEWMTPYKMAVAAWKTLSKPQQVHLAKVIEKEIRHAKAEWARG